ncbi:hypothetical protein F503_08095 [Ophiostoma piceae UAMH 11346]|uniref:Myb-like DNA-binding domain-containing protein n=1 Tax=Ophiostoma piceae (strain UAMH 11346) TaxID=1262450 RepID=S3C1M0_OPHP1|nr:hypothetical protein F503_08095 [Ophiostoma piceae UAMH 11346]
MSTSTEQLNFLLSCIKHTNNGKIDYGAVGAEFGLNKGAASKRYSRLKMRAQESGPSTGAAPCTPSGHGDEEDDASGSIPTPTRTPKSKSVRASGPKTAAAKPATKSATKRKRVQVKNADSDIEEEAYSDVANADAFNPPPSPPRPPKRRKAELAQAAIKKEAAADMEEEIEERLEQDRLLQEQIHADVGNDAGAQDNAVVDCKATSDADAARFIADELEIRLDDYKNATEGNSDEAYTDMTFCLTDNEDI